MEDLENLVLSELGTKIILLENEEKIINEQIDDLVFNLNFFACCKTEPHCTFIHRAIEKKKDKLAIIKKKINNLSNQFNFINKY
jgi:hypothetical protein